MHLICVGCYYFYFFRSINYYPVIWRYVDVVFGCYCFNGKIIVNLYWYVLVRRYNFSVISCRYAIVKRYNVIYWVNCINYFCWNILDILSFVTVKQIVFYPNILRLTSLNELLSFKMSLIILMASVCIFRFIVASLAL